MKTNLEAKWAVEGAVDDAVWDAVVRDVDWSLQYAVQWAVYLAVDDSVWDAVREAVARRFRDEK